MHSTTHVTSLCCWWRYVSEYSSGFHLHVETLQGGITGLGIFGERVNVQHILHESNKNSRGTQRLCPLPANETYYIAHVYTVQELKILSTTCACTMHMNVHVAVCVYVYMYVMFNRMHKTMVCTQLQRHVLKSMTDVWKACLTCVAYKTTEVHVL